MFESTKMTNIIAALSLICTFLGTIFLPYVSPTLRIFTIVSIVFLGFIFLMIVGISLFKAQIKNLTKSAIFDAIGSTILSSVLNYKYNPDDGIIYKGNIRNVIVRVDTIINCLRFLISKYKSTDEELRKLGEIIGGSFSHDFNEELLKGKKKKDLVFKEKLSIFTEYDGTAGWGKYDFIEFYENCTGRIKIVNSFLSSSSNRYDRSLCSFMEGYFEGALMGLFNFDCEVRATSSCGNPIHSPCVFNVTLIK